MLAKRYQDEMYRFIETVLKEIGPRESCSENERRLRQYLTARWKEMGHKVWTEKFTCHPKAFLGFIPYSVLFYLAATIFYWISPGVCFILALISSGMIFFELLRYDELLDRFFPERQGENVIAVISPPETVKRRVIVSAHQDSAYEFNLWYFLKNAAIPFMIVGFGAPLVPMIGGFAKMVWENPGSDKLFNVIGYVCIGLYPVVGLNLFFHTYSVVPGAMDDLAGISVITGVGKALSEANEQHVPLFKHTEVVLLATSSEEAGLRGAKRYVSLHEKEFDAIPTYNINVDGIYDEAFLTVIYWELFTGVRHDRALVRLAQSVAAKHHWPIITRMIPLGATDATAFTKKRIPAVSLICQDTSRLARNYHTRLDTLDHIHPESLGVTLQMVLDMIEEMDTKN